ncbi:MAG: hypothetical protein P1P64_04830 [Treponemataceae bacterium]
MYDYQSFYEGYVSAEKLEKGKLLEQLKVGIYFDCKNLIGIKGSEASDFLQNIFAKSETLISEYRGASKDFFADLKDFLEKELDKFKTALE